MTQEDIKTVSEQIQEVTKKYHLTPRQWAQVSSMIFSLCRGEKVMIIAHRKAGQATIYRATKEIADLLKLEGTLTCADAGSLKIQGERCSQIIIDSV